MMFIKEVMEKIWWPVSLKYKRTYEIAKKMTAEELYKKLSAQKMSFFPYTGVTMNYIDTIGCPHRRSNGKLSGCSMCDFQSEHTEKQAYLFALREKSPGLYARVVSGAVRDARKGNTNIIENLSGYDSFDYEEVPKELCVELFEKEVFSDMPFIYNVEARASSITRERVARFKETVKYKRRVSIDFGVETYDEWIRNNWLNKNVTNLQITNAIKYLHEYGFKAVGNVLLGIPGLTERQSIEQFISSVIWLDEEGIDKIIIHVLNRKKYTLQGFMYRELSENEDLKKNGLVSGEHTGVPWLFTVITALQELYSKYPHVMKKVSIVRIDEKFNSVKNDIAYNRSPDCTCNEVIIGLINNLAIDRNFEILQEVDQKSICDSCWTDYCHLLEKQDQLAGIGDAIDIVARNVAGKVFGSQWRKYYDELIIPEKYFRR